MGKLIYSMTVSLDGYVADKQGNLDWGRPSEDELEFINDVYRNVRTFLLGRRVCETMAVWDTMKLDGAGPGVKDFAKIWDGAKKVMYSRSRSEPFTQNTTIEHSFDADKIRELQRASDADINIAGPNLAAEAIKAGLVDEYHEYIAPVLLGGGIRWLPPDVEARLEVVDIRKFKNGSVHLQYQPV